MNVAKVSIEREWFNPGIFAISATMEEHASHGGGFLLFSGAKSSSTSFSSAGIHTSSTEKSFNIKITTPQIIGYYLQATPADKSTIIDEISDEETAAGFVTISKFVEDYKKLLQAMNKKNNAEQQN